MNTTDPIQTDASTPPRRGSAALQTLLIVVILLGGLFVGVAILRGGKKAPAGQEQAEAEPGEKRPAHDHGAHEEHGGKRRVELSPEKRQNAHLEMETVGTARIHLGLTVFGKIVPDEEKLAHVSPRFAGVVRRVHKRLGEHVDAGEPLATVESNESLQSYDLKALLAGTIIERNVTVGEFVGTDKSLFTVADLRTVWVDFQIYQQDFARLRLGCPVRISLHGRSTSDAPGTVPPPLTQENADGTAAAQVDGSIESTVAYLSPFGTEHTQTLLARAYVPNEAGTWRPGLFVTGTLVVAEVDAPVAVREAAVQTLDGKEVVFVEEGDGFEAREVAVGRRDEAWAEILAGVRPGDRYVAVNAFLLKAEIGKEGAEHED